MPRGNPTMYRLGREKMVEKDKKEKPMKPSKKMKKMEG